MESPNASLTLVLALAAGVLAQSIARRARVPGIVVLLVTGVALGPDGLGWVLPRTLGAGFDSVVDIAVAVILFEGGLNLDISRLRGEQAAIRRLVTWGALCTFIGGALAAHWILDWAWVQSILFGSLVVVTGPTVIGPLITELRLRTRVANVLRAEGVLIDPIGAILAVLVLELVIQPDAAAHGALDLLLRFGFGSLAGVATGLLLVALLRVRRFVPEGFENIFVLAVVLLLFEGCDEFVSHSGVLAVTVAGVIVGNRGTAVDRDLREFKDQLTVLLIGLLFVLLAADVRYEQVFALGLPGLGVVAALIFIVRPVSVALTTMGSDLTWRERAFVGWVAPRGIVAAAIASFVASAMEGSGLEGGVPIRALVFLTIAVTVVQAGLTAPLIGRLLNVRLPGREGYVILGAQGLGMILAKELRAGGSPVVIFDSNQQVCRQARNAGFNVVEGNALEEKTLERARLEIVKGAVGLTANQPLNGLFVGRARELFQVPNGLVAMEELETGMVSEMVASESVDVLFDDAHDVECWEVRARRGEVEVVHVTYVPPGDAAESKEDAGAETGSGRPAEAGEASPGEPQPTANPEHYVMISLVRGGTIEPISMRYTPREGDVVAVALHVPDREAALAGLADRGWELPSEVDDAGSADETAAES